QTCALPISATTPSATSWARPPPTTPEIPTDSASSPRCGSPEPPSPNRALFPPDAPARDSPGWLEFLRRLLRRLNPARRLRTNPRVIKRKMRLTPFGGHPDWPGEPGRRGCPHGCQEEELYPGVPS